ncbi:MoaD/ThiS family protein [Actinomycetospora sp. NBRC 106378]|uniref:MoaD/ThiS family protein n=1 Tax=Actinomycetospora sp. NBRC 106378 TaxID=3032208 RepID=UPI0024A4F784|nr:MoaD/ThiS family protein [Actinomycetospora sp. NBRC 106378]GLZ55131.1 molybdopterin synthase sulfur carrier subunit [Actinomycetospora sp. NBRC 106378]
MTNSLDTRTVTVTVRYFAGAKAAAGQGSEPVSVPAGTTVAALVEAIASDHGEALVKVLAASSFLLDGTAVHSRDEALADGAVLDVLPPFAGG